MIGVRLTVLLESGALGLGPAFCLGGPRPRAYRYAASDLGCGARERRTHAE